jgi:hypothetical protein
MRNHVDVPDGTVWQEHSMLNVQIHAVLRRAIPELLHLVQVVGMNPIEYQIESRMRFSCETQNSVRFVRPNQFASANLPSECSRMSQSLSFCQILPSSLQLRLRALQIFIGFRKGIRSLGMPNVQDVG